MKFIKVWFKNYFDDDTLKIENDMLVIKSTDRNQIANFTCNFVRTCGNDPKFIKDSRANSRIIAEWNNDKAKFGIDYQDESCNLDSGFVIKFNYLDWFSEVVNENNVSKKLEEMVNEGKKRKNQYHKCMWTKMGPEPGPSEEEVSEFSSIDELYSLELFVETRKSKTDLFFSIEPVINRLMQIILWRPNEMILEKGMDGSGSDEEMT